MSLRYKHIQLQQIWRNVLIGLLTGFVLLFTDHAQAQVAAAPNSRLIGTIQGQLGGAVFQDAAGKQFFFRLYEKLPDGTQIVKLNDDSILLKSADGSMYEMYISHDTKAVSAANLPAVHSPVNADNVPQSRSNLPPNVAPKLRSSIEKEYTERQKRRQLRRERRTYEEE